MTSDPDTTDERRRRGPAERYVREFTAQRQAGRELTEMEQALFMVLVDWKCDSEMRPSSGEGSDCSDLMNVALARLQGLALGHLTPEQVLDSIEESR